MPASKPQPARVLLVLAALLPLGCAAPPTRPPAPAPSAPSPSAPAPSPRPASALNPNTDPCAARLHDLCGPLLLFHALNHRLPKSLDELAHLPAQNPPLPLACPISDQPYLYNPAGLVQTSDESRIILADPAPSHAGMRWAVSIQNPDAPGPLVTKVIALPNSRFPR